VEAALEAGLEPVKINVVVLEHLFDELEGFVELVRRLPVHVRFIEYMSPCGMFDDSYYVSAEEIKKRLGKCGELTRSDLPPLGAGPARYYSLRGARGTIGFISPVSSHFCPECNRLRLTADGKMKPCLFSRRRTMYGRYSAAVQTTNWCSTRSDAPWRGNRATTAVSRIPPAGACPR